MPDSGDRPKPLVIPLVGCDAKSRADLKENNMMCVDMGTPEDPVVVHSMSAG
jgi:hypothetical protein